jgi:hypothetical protein
MPENGFTDIALRDVRDGKETIETLQERSDRNADRSDEVSQKIYTGVEAALDILKSA